MAVHALKLGVAASLALVLATQLRGASSQARDGAYALYEGGARPADAADAPPAPAPAPAPAPSPAAVPQFGASLFLGGPWDWGARCLEMVDRVAAQGIATEIQLLPTFYWVDAGPRAPPLGFDPSCAGAGLSDYYCYSRYNSTTVAHWCASRRDDGSCPEITPAEIAEFQTRIGACMARAVAANLSVALNVRVDDGAALGGWRNTLDFDPTRRYGKFSYEEAILTPLADAAAAAAHPGARLAFVPQGEMGASVFFFPEEWVGVNARLRARLARGGAQAEIGLAINNSKACGCLGIGIIDGNEYLRFLKANFDPNQYPQGLPAIRSAFEAADFIAISAYVPTSGPGFDACELEGLMARLNEELAYYGFTLRTLAARGVGVRFAEFGVGGGAAQDGATPAATAAEAAYTPFFGIAGPRTCAADPFKMCDVGAANGPREYRREYFRKASQYLARGGCEYRAAVESVYVWGTGSWDVLGTYPGDDGDAATADEVVLETLRAHNAAARAGAPAGGG